MGSPNLSVSSSVQDLISSSGDYDSVPIDTYMSQAIEHPSSSTLEVPKGVVQAKISCLSLENSSDDLNRINTKDSGWWLVLDTFVRQKQWSRLAKLNASSVRLDLQELQREGEVLKRGIDIAVALVLLILLMPALIVISILIRLESRGPALFCHSRVGEGGKEFKLWKLRSMRTDALRYERSPTSGGDPRLTGIGRAIRRISLDELPQLVNVLKGEMSLVGPRPEMAFIVNRYSSLERKRLLVKPGITGLWQISAGRAAPIHHNLQYDLYYIQHKNLRLDIAILLRTITAVICGIGAV